MNRQSIEARYEEMFGFVPDNIKSRLAVAEAAERLPALEALERFRHEFLDGGSLPTPVQRLVHFGITLAQADSEVIEIHAKASLRSGATVRELFGVCETAAVVLGMPAFSRGMRVLAALLPAQAVAGANGDAAAR